ncbi:carbohydrate-binding protein [Gluconacetobacter azotocaptans]|uniref:glycoside hydrolase family 66 protein n=1 Tax=Gluconacetobacter azotocaptans TaxID=142834 RepID=UPI00195B225E|nr:glycoside hydrolase family 66 protein [Gluconacetobacter azotocaptans]MBM9400391.1 carbohydrate-binding protein [Gluconacetobacter azotocaptans]
MHRLSTFLAAGLALASPALGASLQGPLIKHVIDDQAYYSPGAIAHVTVGLTNGTGMPWSGHIDVALCSRGQVIGSILAQSVVGLPVGASTGLTYSVTVPALYAHGYQMSIAGLASSDSGTATCTGSGSSSASPVDQASGAIDVASSAWEDPIEAFVDAPTLASTSVTAQQVAANLAQYHVGLIQGYDLTWRHDEPHSPAASWPNLAGVTVTRATLNAYQAAFHGYDMKMLAYQLWNGAWPDYPAANPNVGASMGVYPANASGLPSCTKGGCGVAQQASVGGGWLAWGWSADRIVEENPFNSRWATWMQGQWKLLLSQDGYDGVHLDTLGEPGLILYDIAGRKLPDLGAAIADFTNSTQAQLGVCTDINQVSAWNLQDEAIRGHSCNLYVEPHPEFADNPFYSSIGGLTGQMNEWTRRKLIVAYYPQRVMSGDLDPSYAVSGDSVTVCNPNHQTGCLANNPGIELLLGQVAVAGASELLLGDLDHLVPGPFFPGASLEIDGPLQQYLADYYNWFVGMRDLLREGATSSSEIVTVSSSGGANIGSSTGAAGSVYYVSWTRPGIAAALSLTNLVGLSDNRIDDPDGKHHPVAQTGLVVTTEVYGATAPGTLWYSAPDINHGLPQSLAYTLSATTDSKGMRIATFTVPLLKTVGYLALEGGNFTTATDYRIGVLDFTRGGTANNFSNGSGPFNQSGGHACCGRYMRWDAVDFGTGVTTLTMLTQSASGAPVAFYVDAPDGPPIVTAYAPPTTGAAFATVTATVGNSPTGIHSVYVRFPDRDVTLVGWKP